MPSPKKTSLTIVSPWKRLLLVGFTAVAGAAPLHAQTLVRANQPLATIVVDKNATPQVQKAAKLLQTTIAKSSGATLPISDAAPTGAALHVGNTAFVAGRKLKPGNLDQEGFILRKIDDNNFVIVGGSDWGTEFGVYDFLERYLGVRWLLPSELGEDVPSHANIVLPAANLREEPVFLSRRLSPLNIEGQKAQDVWARQNRARGRIEFHHNLLKLFPPSQYAQTHPEYFPETDGKRYIPRDDIDPNWQPNFSAPGIADEAVKNIDAYFRANPNAPSYSLGMNDSIKFDDSPASKARRTGRKNYLGEPDVSNDYFLWANDVVSRVLQKHPGKLFGTLAYHNLVDPPQDMPVNAAIVPFLTYERMRWADPELRANDQSLTKRWAAVAPNVGWYDYAYGISYQLPRVWFHQQQEYLSWGAKNGVTHHYAELYPNFGTGPMAWVMAKLLWNPHQNVDVLLDDWYQHAAGKAAAPKLREYYAIWEKFWTQDIQNSKWNRKTGQYLDFNGNPSYLSDVPQEYLTRSDALLNEALQLADTPQRKARVAKLQEMWHFYRASVVTYQSATTLKLDTEEQALKGVDDAVATLKAAQQRTALLKSFKDDPLYDIAQEYILRYEGTHGADWGQGALWQLLPWISKSERVKAKIDTVIEANPGAVAASARLLLQVAQNGGGTQLLSNPTFEGGTKGWSIWDKANEGQEFHRGTFTPQADGGVWVEGLSRGSLMQTVPYQAGSFYVSVAYTVPESIAKGHGTLMIQLLDANGKMLRDKNVNLPSSNVALAATSGNTVVAPFELPAEHATAKSIRLMLLLDGLAPDEKVLVKSVGIYRLGK